MRHEPTVHNAHASQQTLTETQYDELELERQHGRNAPLHVRIHTRAGRRRTLGSALPQRPRLEFRVLRGSVVRAEVYPPRPVLDVSRDCTPGCECSGVTRRQRRGLGLPYSVGGGRASNSVIRLTWRPRVDDAHEAMALVVLRCEDDAVDLGSVL